MHRATIAGLCLLLAVFLVAYVESQSPTETLRHVEIFFRHGDRAPVNFIPSMPQMKQVFNQGPGVLTNMGIVEEFQLGLWLNKYSPVQEYLGKNFSVQMFHIRSTFVERTVMSAESFVAGLYNNNTSPLKPKYGYKWSPIPIFTVPLKYDILLDKAHCPRASEIHDEKLQTPSALEYTAKHQKMFDILTEKSGFGFPINQTNQWFVEDPLNCWVTHGYPLPCWCPPNLFAELKDAFKYYWFEEFCTSSELLQISFGVFIDELLDRLVSIANGTKLPEDIKNLPMLAFSAHDTSLTYYLSALGLYTQPFVITYASGLLLQLYGPELSPAPLNQFFVKYMYRNGTSDNSYTYRMIPWCSGQVSAEQGCPLDVFVEKLNWMRMSRTQRAQGCVATHTSTDAPINLHSQIWILSLAIIVIFLCLIAIVITTTCYISRSNRVRNASDKVGLEGGVSTSAASSSSVQKQTPYNPEEEDGQSSRDSYLRSTM